MASPTLAFVHISLLIFESHLFVGNLVVSVFIGLVSASASASCLPHEQAHHFVVILVAEPICGLSTNHVGDFMITRACFAPTHPELISLLSV